MEISEDLWLASIFARPVFRVSLSGDESPSADLLLDHVDRQQSAFYYAKVDTGRIAQVRALSAAGFTVVDVNITLGLDPPWPSPTAMVPVSEARPEEEVTLAGIAGVCFKYSRFHLDPLVPQELADRIKKEWVASYFRGKRGERIYAARVDASPVGFLAVIAVPSGRGIVRVIDLIGVDPAHQGGGIGKALVSRFICEEGPRSMRLEVGTQAANTRSLRFYEGMGFRTERSQYVLHRHVPDRLYSD
jgi:ribosomal protein S18 acetylase RimI-like enzyme